MNSKLFLDQTRKYMQLEDMEVQAQKAKKNNRTNKYRATA